MSIPGKLHRIIFYWIKIKSMITRNGFFGSYASFKEAQNKVTGYNSREIFDKVTLASRKVRDGEAAFERDGAVFMEPEYSWSLLSCLLFAIAKRQGPFRVLDFGGALGSHYFQYRKWMPADRVSWNIVEQKDFVAIGQKEFQTEALHFYDSIEEVVEQGAPDLIMLGCVLPYLEDPWKYLDQLCETGAEYLLIDKHPMIGGKEDRITIQHVPPDIYTAEYPAWFFSEQKFLAHMSKHELIATYEYPYVFNINSQFKGYFYRLTRSGK